jgi:Tol biopolymer transport system component
VIQGQKSKHQKGKALSISIALGCGCIGMVLCLTAGLAGVKLALSSAGDSDYRPAWSPDGTQIAFFSTRDGNGDIYLMQSDGSHVVRLTNAFFSFGLLVQNSDPAWSPDNKQLVFVSSRNGHDDIYIMDGDGSHVVRLTNSRVEGKASNTDPDWSPDGQQIIFTSQQGENGAALPAFGGPPLPTADIYSVNVDGTHLTRLTNLDGYVQNPKCSPDGSKIAFALVKKQTDLYVMDADGTNIMQLTNDSALEGYPDWSPDGSRIVFASGDLYHHDIFVMNANGTNIKQLTHSPDFGDTDPFWSPDGDRIAFVSMQPETRLEHIFIMNSDGSNVLQLTGN